MNRETRRKLGRGTLARFAVAALLALVWLGGAVAAQGDQEGILQGVSEDAWKALLLVLLLEIMLRQPDLGVSAGVPTAADGTADGNAVPKGTLPPPAEDPADT